MVRPSARRGSPQFPDAASDYDSLSLASRKSNAVFIYYPNDVGGEETILKGGIDFGNSAHNVCGVDEFDGDIDNVKRAFI